jgi:hypothetical protein
VDAELPLPKEPGGAVGPHHAPLERCEAGRLVVRRHWERSRVKGRQQGSTAGQSPQKVLCQSNPASKDQQAQQAKGSAQGMKNPTDISVDEGLTLPPLCLGRFKALPHFLRSRRRPR